MLEITDRLLCSTTEAVQRATLAFQRINDVHGGDRLAFGVLSVRNCITNDVFQEDLQNATCFLVDKATDTFSSTTSLSLTGRTSIPPLWHKPPKPAWTPARQRILKQPLTSCPSPSCPSITVAHLKKMSSSLTAFTMIC